MTSPRSATLPSFEDTRPAPYLTAEWSRTTPSAGRWSTVLPPARPLPQDAWLIELPQVDPPPTPARAERHAPLWLRVVGLAAAALLALLALAVAASLLDAQLLHRSHSAERLAAVARG
jgi:hypothetical protein